MIVQRFGKPTVRAVVVLVSLLAGSFVGCGYSTQRPFPTTVPEASVGVEAADDETTSRGGSAKIRTVFVEPLRSKAFRRELEMRLTEAVSKRIETVTPYRIAAKERADTSLTGEILEVRQAVFGTDFVIDRPRETAVSFLVRLRWSHHRTGKVLMDRKVLIQTETWVPTVGETFYKGSDRGIDELAERVVQQMETVW